MFLAKNRFLKLEEEKQVVSAKDLKVYLDYSA
jgi:hypothetical protein